jgi:LPS O-antigen subunit length determinant protein (WzzB/FepE family)
VSQLRAEIRQEEVGSLRTYEQETIDFGPALATIWSNRRVIGVSVMTAVLLTVISAAVLLPRSYLAFSVLRPIAKATSAGRVLGAFVGSGGIGLGSLAGLVGGTGGPGAEEAEQDMTILQSFAFTSALVERYHLDDMYKPIWLPVPMILRTKDPRWRAYRRMKKAFSCYYSTQTGNISLYFEAKSPEEAQRILGYYVDDLRQKLRSQEVQNAQAAIDSMKAEARTTSDALLQSQLYELIAKQMQQLKLAEVEADFAFSVLEPPISPDKPYSPSVPLDAAVVGVIALMLSSVFVVWRDVRLRRRGASRALITRRATDPY